MFATFSDLPFELHQQIVEELIRSLLDDLAIELDIKLHDGHIRDIGLAQYAPVNHVWRTIIQDRIFAHIYVTNHGGGKKGLKDLVKLPPRLRQSIKRISFGFRYDDKKETGEANQQIVPGLYQELWQFLADPASEVTELNLFSHDPDWEDPKDPWAPRRTKLERLDFCTLALENLPMVPKIVSLSFSAQHLSSRKLMSPRCLEMCLEKLPSLEKLHYNLYRIPSDVPRRLDNYKDLIGSIHSWPLTITHLHLTHRYVLPSRSLYASPEASGAEASEFLQALRQFSRHLKSLKVEATRMNSAFFSPYKSGSEEIDEWPQLEVFDLSYLPEDTSGDSFYDLRYSPDRDYSKRLVHPNHDQMKELYMGASKAMLKMPKIKFFKLYESTHMDLIKRLG
jgi:hypothetical protein